MWSDPWWVLGWIVVGTSVTCLALLATLVAGALVWAWHWSWHVVRDTRRWRVELPERATWYKANGDTVTVLAQQLPPGMFTLDTGAALHLHKKPADVAAMLKRDSRRARPWGVA